MAILVTALSVLAFVIAFGRLGILPKAQAAMAVSRQTMTVMGDATLDDSVKERAARQASLALLKGFFGIALRLAGVLLAAYVPVFLADRAGLLPEAEALAFMLRLDVLAATTVLVALALWLASRFRHRKL